MQKTSIPMRLFRARRQIDAAISVISECARDERKVRQKKRHFQKIAENGFPISEALPVETLHGIVARRYRARESILAAAEAFFEVCALVDATMTVQQKAELLGAAHRVDCTVSIGLSGLVAQGHELPPSRDPGIGALKFAGLLATTPMFLSQHNAERPVVEAYEARQGHANRVRSVGMQAMPASWIADRLAANHGFIHAPAPGVH